MFATIEQPAFVSDSVCSVKIGVCAQISQRDRLIFEAAIRDALSTLLMGLFGPGV